MSRPPAFRSNLLKTLMRRLSLDEVTRAKSLGIRKAAELIASSSLLPEPSAAREQQVTEASKQQHATSQSNPCTPVSLLTPDQFSLQQLEQSGSPPSVSVLLNDSNVAPTSQPAHHQHQSRLTLPNSDSEYEQECPVIPSEMASPISSTSAFSVQFIPNSNSSSSLDNISVSASESNERMVLVRASDLKRMRRRIRELEEHIKGRPAQFRSDSDSRTSASETGTSNGVLGPAQQHENYVSAKRHIMANVSHEIRTPLNGIIGSADILLAETSSFTQEQMEHMQIIRSCGSVLRNIVDDMLDYAKIEYGNLKIKPHMCDLRACLTNVMKIDPYCYASSKTAAMAGSNTEFPRRVKMSCVVDTRIPTNIVVDETRLSQILLHLTSNSKKFTAQGEIRITVTESKRDADGSVLLTFVVLDTGIGIAKENARTLFEPFRTVNSINSNAPGTGLGLPICANLVRAMGGRMWMESEYGHGSKCYFTIRTSYGDFEESSDITPARTVNFEDSDAISELSYSSDTSGSLSSSSSSRNATSAPGSRRASKVEESENMLSLPITIPALRSSSITAARRASSPMVPAMSSFPPNKWPSQLNPGASLPRCSLQYEKLMEIELGVGSLWRVNSVEHRRRASVSYHPTSEDSPLLESGHETTTPATHVSPEMVIHLTSPPSEHPPVDLPSRRPESPDVSMNVLSSSPPVFSSSRASPPGHSSTVDRELALRCPMQILIAEDHPVNMRLCVYMLELFGYVRGTHFDTVQDGQQVVEITKMRDYDLLLLDIMMPVLSGWDASLEIHKRHPTKQARPTIIMVSACVDEEDQSILTSGIADHSIRKPYKAQHLAHIIERVFIQRKADGTLRSNAHL